MTEGNDDGNNLVRVRAQVMMRDDSRGGWLPMGGGGLSNVSVRKRILKSDLDDPKHEYLIYGKRISDQMVVLSCTIKKDFEYNKVMPTFHHWRTGDHKFGLTFQTAADARAFDKGVRAAVDDLLDGLSDTNSYYYGNHLEGGDDEVFMAINLPVDRDGSRSSSGSVTTSSGSRHTPTTTPLPTPDHPTHTHHTTTAPSSVMAPLTTADLHLHHHPHLHPSHLGGSGGGLTSTSASAPAVMGQSYGHLYRMTYLTRPKPALPAGLLVKSDSEKLPAINPSCQEGHLDADKMEILGDTYVQFDKNQSPPALHEYSYPVVEGFKSDRRDSISSLKKHQQLELVGSTPDPPHLSRLSRKRDRHISSSRKNMKVRCRHCHDTFTEDNNPRGSCEYAPDCVRTAIDKLSCISCARCMLYHCMSDAEGEFPHHPCECGGPSGAVDESCGKRWVGLALLSLLVPCLWCYPPLEGCHRCAVAYGICGGRHQSS